MDRFLHVVGRVHDDREVHSVWQIFREAVELVDAALCHVEGVGARELVDADGASGLSVDGGAVGIAVRSEVDLGHVFEAEHPGAVAADYDVAELFGRRQAPVADESVFKRCVGVERGLTHRSGAHLDVLRLDGSRDVGRREVAYAHRFRIEPYAHAVVAAAEGLHAAHSLHAAERVDEVELGIIGEVEGVVALRVVGKESHEENLVARLFVDAHSLLCHLGRQRAADERYAVLHVDGGLVEVGAVFKSDGERVASVASRIAAHVEHTFHTVDLLLDGHAYGLCHGVGGGSRIGSAHHHGGWRDVGILRHRQREIAHRARQHHQHGDDGGENRAVYKKLGEHSAGFIQVSQAQLEVYRFISL